MTHTVQDIEKYFSGKLSAQQMHAMEKAALDDPFLAEAMEGYGGMQDKEWKEQLALAHKQIAEAATGAKVIPMHRSRARWWKAAAAVLVIGGASALALVLTNKKEEDKAVPQIAQTETIAVPPPAAKDNTGPSPAKELVNPPAGLAEEKRTGADVTVVKPGQQVMPDDDFVYKPGKALANDSANLVVNDQAGNNNTRNDAVIISPANSAPSANNNIAPGRERSLELAKETEKKNEADGELLKSKTANAVSKKDKAVNNFFNAQVVGADNSPLPFSNITVKSGSFETYADVKGNFRLFSSDSLLNIEIRSVGYLPRTYSLRSNQPMNRIILLEDETAIKDRMVIQKGNATVSSRTRRASVLSDSAINVEPKDGWDNYNTYVANNLNIPEGMPKNESHGEVELSFDVKANGTISNIRVNKSLGATYDEAAKRLIMQGPQWKVKKGRKTSASVKVKF